MSHFGTRGPLKRLKCKGAGSCRGATERGERRSEGPRGRESRGGSPGERKGRRQRQVAANMSPVCQKT